MQLPEETKNGEEKIKGKEIYDKVRTTRKTCPILRDSKLPSNQCVAEKCAWFVTPYIDPSESQTEEKWMKRIREFGCCAIKYLINLGRDLSRG